MAEPVPWYEDLVLPVLLSEARKTYGAAIQKALERVGLDDLPRTGARVVGGIARNGEVMIRDIAGWNGASKQAASQLVDTLVTRGYVNRVPVEGDRRRLAVGLTERGEAAAAEIRGAVDAVDAAFASAVGDRGVAELRASLAALVELRGEH